MSPAWQAYRFWRRLFWLFFLGAVVWFFPVAITSGAIGQWSKDAGNAFYFAAMLPWALVWVYAHWRVRNFSCPRCGKRFFGSWYYFVGRCVYCGLPKWTEPDDKVE